MRPNTKRETTHSCVRCGCCCPKEQAQACAAYGIVVEPLFVCDLCAVWLLRTVLACPESHKWLKRVLEEER